MENSAAISAMPQPAAVPGSKAASDPQSRPPIRLNAILLISLTSVALALCTASECHSVFYPPSLQYGLALWGWWGIVGSAIWKLGERRPATLAFSPKVLAAHLFAGSVLGFLHAILMDRLLYKGFFNINRVALELFIYGFIFGIAGIAQLQLRAQRDAMQSLALERQLSEAHLRALQMQLEPHFLFNTLNAITTLVELGRQQQAVEMLAHLNAILKSTLKRTTPEKVPLSQELEIVENYLAIEQVRFADRLRVEIRIEPGALDGLVPCFLLQPIVENAIRHGIANCENEGVVEASVRRDGDALELRVRDTGRGTASHPVNGHGIGLKNTRERLTHFYRGQFAMKAQPLDAGGFEVDIRIPYECA